MLPPSGAEQHVRDAVMPAIEDALSRSGAFAVVARATQGHELSSDSLGALRPAAELRSFCEAAGATHVVAPSLRGEPPGYSFVITVLDIATGAVSCRAAAEGSLETIVRRAIPVLVAEMASEVTTFREADAQTGR